MSRCVVGTLLLVGAMGASAMPAKSEHASTKQVCQMASELAGRYARERDEGVSYHAQLTQMETASKGLAPAFGMIAKASLNAAYKDMAKSSPDAVVAVVYIGCMQGVKKEG